MHRPYDLSSSSLVLWSPGSPDEIWSLFSALVAHDLPTVEFLLHHNPSLARAQHHYRTAFYFAVRENNLPAARLLLQLEPNQFELVIGDPFLLMAEDRGFDEMAQFIRHHLIAVLNASPLGNPTAAAIRQRDLPTLRRLLDENPALLHQGDQHSNQPIHWATMTRQLDFIDFLHARGANLNAPRANQARPIHLFNGDYHYRGWRDVPPEITTKPYEVLRHLISLGAEMDLNTACHLGDLDLVRAMVAQDPSLVNRCSPYITYYLGSGAPISNAASRGHVEIVRFLLAQGADPNLPEEGIAPRGHALYHAAAQGNYELAELLLAHGANPSCPVESSADGLSRAISNNDARMVALLETHGARRGLDICAYYGDIERARLVLEPDPGALRTAAEEGNLDFVEFLIAAYPELPTQVSVAAKTREITDLLFAHGMPATLPDWLGETALHRLARRGDTENAALFLDRGADLHAREDNDSSTPLALAAKHNQPAMVRFLLSRGALAQHPADPPWATPRAWAQRRGNREILDILDKNE